MKTMVKGYGKRPVCLLCRLPVLNRIASAKYHKDCQRGLKRLKSLKRNRENMAWVDRWFERQVTLLRKEMVAFHTFNFF